MTAIRLSGIPSGIGWDAALSEFVTRSEYNGIVFTHDCKSAANTTEEAAESGIAVDVLAESSPHMVRLVDALVTVCSLLQKPENHHYQQSTRSHTILYPHGSGYDGEMARELISLPKYTAYAKILKEDNSTQTVEKHTNLRSYAGGEME
jgi:hypothetical protein